MKTKEKIDVGIGSVGFFCLLYAVLFVPLPQDVLLLIYITQGLALTIVAIGIWNLWRSKKIKGKEQNDKNLLCKICKKRPRKEHSDKGLSCGDDYCDECFEEMRSECRRKSW